MLFGPCCDLGHKNTFSKMMIMIKFDTCKYCLFSFSSDPPPPPFGSKKVKATTFWCLPLLQASSPQVVVFKATPSNSTLGKTRLHRGQSAIGAQVSSSRSPTTVSDTIERGVE